jgi:hypothetical protein
MSGSDYNFMSRLLHRVALQSTAIAEVSFDIENAFVKKKGIAFEDQHVFITGLARSGTTILMRYLYETGLFRSLTYQDMPFVLMPNVWGRINYKKIAAVYKERAHQDKIMVGFDSPEALEEIFWRTFCADEYILNDRLQLHHIDNDVFEKFKDYINNILLSGNEKQTRYLSKNNNNVLRLQQLQAGMPNARFIIPFREPLQHALSLLNQHLHFSKIQENDKFPLQYMNWLGHFEFGLNQKTFFLNDADIFEQMKSYEKTDLNFWLLNWKNYYKYVTNNITENTILFNYEDFCRHPTQVIQKLFTELNIDVPNIKFEPFTPSTKNTASFDENLLAECSSIYIQLLNSVI